MAEVVAKRYGSALFELAVETNKVEIIQQQLEELKNILEKEIDLLEILNHPKIVVEEKITLIENIFKDKLINEVLGLLVIIIKKGRVNNIVNIINYCLELIYKLKGNEKAFVTSAIPLSKEQIEKIKNKLEETTDKKIEIITNIDKTLIGGLIIRIGNRIIDNSIKGKINAISKEIYSIQLN